MNTQLHTMQHNPTQHNAAKPSVTQHEAVHAPLPQAHASTSGALYEQLAAVIRDHIRSGEWGAGFRLPSEHEFMQAFTMSRGTVRRALKDLVDEGLLVQERGRGTFVSDPTITHGPGEITLSVAAALAEKGLPFVTRVLEQQVLPAPPEVATSLSLDPGADVLFLRRVRECAGKPSVCQESWLNLAACPGLEQTDFCHESAFDAVQRTSGHKIVSSKMRYAARRATLTYAAYLSCEPGDALLMLEQLISLDTRVPIEWSRTWFAQDHAIATMATPPARQPAHAPAEPRAQQSSTHASPSEAVQPLSNLPQAGLTGSFPVLGIPAQPAATDARKKDLEALALKLRQRAVQFALDDPAHPYHLGGSLSCAEILAALYGSVMHTGAPCREKPDAQTPYDRLVFSKGHGALTLYPALEHAGLLSKEDVAAGLYGPEAHIFKHPKRDTSRGIEFSAGSLGMGPGFAAGLALAKRRQKQGGRIFCLVGDGECNEGSVWESLQFVGHLTLSNYVLIVDANGFQLDGPTSDVLDTGSLAARIAATGFDVAECDGHDVCALVDALSAQHRKPFALIAHTHKGQGLSFARDVAHWHDDHMTQAERTRAQLELGIALNQKG